MAGGLIALAAALIVALAAGVALRRRDGRWSVTAGIALSAVDLGAPLGERATLVQFSTEFCSSCGPTRDMLTEVAGSLAGVSLVEIDAAARLDLARRLNVYSTPTVLVLGPDGRIARRAAGRPRRAEVLAALEISGDIGPGSDSQAAGE
jgi:thiol-disulfide isomerase/thioredoxin